MLTFESAPTFSPVKDYDVKASLRIDDDADDALIESLIAACVNQIELENNLRLAARTVTFTFSCLPDDLKLPLHPVSAITSITYLDGNNQRQTLDPTLYQLVQTSGFPKVCRAYNKFYPVILQTEGSVIVTATAGYADGAVPSALIAAAIVMVCDHFSNPDRPLQCGPNVAALLNPHRRGEWL
jgi:uncharacterized phiE125 gp8 family phage protein